MTEPRACILSISGQQLTPGEKTLFAEVNPWGVILMGRSCGAPEQVTALTQDIWSVLGREALIFIDQEGGRVRRLRPPVWPDFPAPGIYGELYKHNPEAGREAAWLHHRLIAAELEPIGIRADCAPVVLLAAEAVGNGHEVAAGVAAAFGVGERDRPRFKHEAPQGVLVG